MVLPIFSETKKIQDQTPVEKMYLLKIMVHQILGAKWRYFKKIKTADQGFNFLKEKTLMEQMKATRSALRFTSKTAKKQYRLAYQACLNDIKKYHGTTEDVPSLPPATEEEAFPANTSLYDATIIRWTPLKFMAPVSRIREKGKATPIHTEGLVAKLFFKVIAYYAAPENWDQQKLTLYLEKLNAESTHQDIVHALEPLKNDLQNFCQLYQQFKFGTHKQQGKDKSKDKDKETFDDGLGLGDFEDQVKTLYWYSCIYSGVELFLFRYFLTLITSTSSIKAIKYLSHIFEPALQKAIENKNLFLGSFETDVSKTPYRKAYAEYCVKKAQEPMIREIKTKKGAFETYNYNLELWNRFALSFEVKETPQDNSEWSIFIRHRFLEKGDSLEAESESLEAAADKVKEIELQEDDDKPQGPEIEFETKDYALIQIMTLMINGIRYRKIARQKILERFKARVLQEREQVEKRIAEIEKRSEKKIGLLKRKISKMARLKQEESVAAFQKDIDEYQAKTEELCKNIKITHEKKLIAQKERLKKLFIEISKENKVSSSTASKIIFQLIKQLDQSGEFSKSFFQYVAHNIQDEYDKELEPFYENLFKIMEPTTQEKLVLIQSLEKSGSSNVRLGLDEDEEVYLKRIMVGLRQKIEKAMPGIFSSKLIFLSVVIPIYDLFKLSIDNKSLQNLLRMQISSLKNPKFKKLPPQGIKMLLLFNQVMNPVPKNDLIIEGKENEKDPQKVINVNKLNKLISQLALDKKQ